MSNQYARELQRCRRAINRLSRDHSISDTSLGEILMDIQVEVSAIVIEAVKNKAINLEVEIPDGDVRGRLLLPFWQNLQAVAHQNGYGPDPNRISDRVVRLKGNGHDLHESTYRRWIPNAIATVEFLLHQLGKTVPMPILSAQWGKGTKWIDVTKQILRLLADKSPFDAASDDFGVKDPAKDRKKQLRLIFAGNPPIVRIVEEHEVLSHGAGVIDHNVGRSASDSETAAALAWAKNHLDQPSAHSKKRMRNRTMPRQRPVSAKGKDVRSLSRLQKLTLQIISNLPEDEKISGRQIVEILQKEHGKITSDPTLYSHVIPAIKPFGVRSRRGHGFWFERPSE